MSRYSSTVPDGPGSTEDDYIIDEFGRSVPRPKGPSRDDNRTGRDYAERDGRDYIGSASSSSSSSSSHYPSHEYGRDRDRDDRRYDDYPSGGGGRDNHHHSYSSSSSSSYRPRSPDYDQQRSYSYRGGDTNEDYGNRGGGNYRSTQGRDYPSSRGGESSTYRRDDNNGNNRGVRRRRSRSNSRDREYRSRNYPDTTNPAPTLSDNDYPLLSSSSSSHANVSGGNSSRYGGGGNSSKGSGGRIINIRERPFDHGIVEGSTVIAEISPALTFPIWLEKNRSEGKIALDVTPAKAAEEYNLYKATYNVNATEAFYKAHRHEEWFRQRYDPVYMLQQRDQRRKESQTTAEEYLQAIDNGTVGHILPTLGGDYTGKHGLGIGLQQALRHKDNHSHDTSMISSHDSFSSSTASPSPLPQIPVLFIRGVSALIPTNDIRQAIETCSHLVRKYTNENINNMGNSGGLSIPSFIAPTYEDMEKVISQASQELYDLLPSASAESSASSNRSNSNTGPHEQLDGPTDDHEETNDNPNGTTSNKRQRLDESSGTSSSSTADPATVQQDRTALFHSLGFDEGSLRSYFNMNTEDKKGYRVPKPVRIELSDARRLPGASYRRNVWVEYANLQEAAVAKYLCRKLTIEVVGGSDPVSSLAELTKLKTLARACSIPDTSNDDSASSVPNSEDYPGTVLLATMNIYKVKLNDAVPDLPLYLTKGSIITAEWHQPMYGALKSSTLSQRRTKGGRNTVNPENDMQLAYAILRGYPYGKKHTCEIPSWASIPEQISIDLPRALELAALMDEENSLFTNTTMDTTASSTSSSSSVDTVSTAPTVPTEVQSSVLYRHLYGTNRGVALHNYSPLQQLDIVINYLRYVHYYDYYSGIQATSAGDLRQAVGDGYLRTALPKNVHHSRTLINPPNVSSSSSASTATMVSTNVSSKPLPSSPNTDTSAERKEDNPPTEESVTTIDVAEAYNELLYGQASTEDSTEGTETATSSSTTLTPTTTDHSDTSLIPSVVDSVSSMSAAARSAYNAWSLKVSQIYRGRSMQARRQIDANKNTNTLKTEKALDDLVVNSTENSSSATALPTLSTGTTNESTTEITQTTLSSSNTLIVSTIPVAKPASKDHLVPVAPVLSRGSNPVPWTLIEHHAQTIEQTKERILSSLPENLLLGEFYAAAIDDSPPRPAPIDPSLPVPETLPDTRRTEPPFIAALVKTMNDPNVISSSKCLLCKKSFKASYYTVKHLMNKHPTEVTAALDTVKSMLHTSLTLCLSDIWFMRRYFFADSRRPIPWHEPSALKILETDNNASIQRLTMQGVSLPHFATALGPAVAEVSGLALPKGPNRGNNTMVPFGMLPSPFLSMFAMNASHTGNIRGGNSMNMNRNNMNRQGQRNNSNVNSTGLLGTGPNNGMNSSSGGGGRYPRQQHNPSQPPLPPTLGGGSMYRDKDAPKSSVVNIPKPNYGNAIVSYDDI